MNSVLLFLLAGSLFIVVFVSGGLAKLFKAKRPFMFLAFIVVVLATTTAIAIHQYYVNDSAIILAAALLVYVVLLFVVLGMSVLDTLVISIASIATMGLVLLAGGMLLDKYQKSHVLDTMTSYVKDNQSFISFDVISPERNQSTLITEQDLEQEEFVAYSESALMPEGARHTLKALKNKTYHVVKLANAYTLKGDTVRILKKDGDILKGTIIETRKSSVVLGVYIPNAKGMITAPVAFSVISKLEVYR